MMAMSFKDANFVAFPIGEWTLDWYVKVIQDKQFLEACLYSIMIAVATTVAATILGVWIAMLIVCRGHLGPGHDLRARLPPGGRARDDLGDFAAHLRRDHRHADGNGGDHPRPYRARRALRRRHGAHPPALDAGATSSMPPGISAPTASSPSSA